MADELDFPVEREPGVLLRVATVSAATGALAGAFEGFGLVLGTQIVLGAGGAFLLVLGTMVLDAVLGLGAGLAGGLVAAALSGRMLRWRRLRLGTALAVLLCAVFFLLPLARDLWLQGRAWPAAGMGGLVLLLSATWWVNANYWFRRESIGAGPKVGWRVYAPLLGVLLGGVSALTGGRPDGPETALPAGVPNLVLVTVDTLRRDHVSVHGGVVQTPNFDRLGLEGVIFDNAITPVPETAPSHVSMFTGLHPARHKVVANGIPLKEGHLTVTEQLAATGYRTGAFVSSFAAGRTTGLAQGFQVYDDDFTPFIPGLSRARVARVALPLLLRFGDPADWPWLLERPAPPTIDRALAWVREGEGPFFLWVHVFEPHSPYERHDCGTPDAAGRCPSEVDHRAILAQEPGYPYTDAERAVLRALYAAEVAYTDAQLGVLFDGLRAAGALENAVVLATSDHGESLGEHGIHFNHHGIYDTVMRVPMVLWSSAPSWTPGTRVDRQVSISDVANTLLELAGIPLLSNTESVPLATHLRGVVVPPRPVWLLGRLEASLSKGQLHGVRDAKGWKYIQGEGGEELYDLERDPEERTNVAEEQPAALSGGRANVGSLKKALGGEKAEAAVDERLRALGYVE